MKYQKSMAEPRILILKINTWDSIPIITMDFEHHSIYIVRNIEKKDLVDYLNDYKHTVEIDDGILRGNVSFNNITVQMLLAEFFVVGVNDFTDLNPETLKSFVHGEMFDVANECLGRSGNTNLKLFIVTDANLIDSIFESDSSIKMRTKELKL
jgi:hypothetical protein